METTAEEFATAQKVFEEDKEKALELFISLDTKTYDLFSTNETLDDVQDHHIKYMTICAYIGLCLAELSIDREVAIKKAKSYLQRFMDLMISYNSIERKDVKMLEMAIAGKKVASELVRETKIIAFKRERETAARIKKLTELGCDGRDLAMFTIDLMIQKSIESIKSLKEEEDLLQFAKHHISPAAKAKAAPSAEESRIDLKKPTEYSGPMLSKSGKPLRPFVLTTEHNKREQIRKGVFQYGHNLPTMSVEEYLELEMERGNFLSGGGKEPEKKQVDEDDHDALDLETYKARDWDEFKDFNPAGWGNRHNKG